jgi:ABC-type sugar transport system substrate-binding protein
MKSTLLTRRLARGSSLSIVAVTTMILAACGTNTSRTSDSGDSSPSGAAPTTVTKKDGFVDYMTTLAPPDFHKPTKTYKVALLDASTVLPQQKSLEVGVQDAAKALGVDLTVYDAGGFQNLQKQVSQFETALATKPDAILILPASPVAFDAEIKEARAAGIKVLPMLIPPPSGNYDYAAADNLVEDAQESVKSIAETIGGKGSLFDISGGAGSTVAEAFQQGVDTEMQKYPNMKIVYSKDLPGYSAGDAQSAAEAGLAAHPDVSGILTNDTILGLGAAKATSAKGLSNVPVAGIGPGDQSGIDALKSGQITVGATPPFYAVGYTTVEWATHILDGGDVPQKTVVVPPMILTKDNIADAISSKALFQVLAPSAIGCGPGEASDC